MTPEDVDKFNPKKTSILAMQQAVEKIKITPDYLLIDAEKIDSNIPMLSIIKGDANSISIAAASILAKVTRDRYMVELAKKYPEYGFEKHVGYGTKIHMDALKKYGPIKGLHRFSYKPIKELL
jgi:ribonuclease HII